jgi:hypothetical protein
MALNIKYLKQIKIMSTQMSADSMSSFSLTYVLNIEGGRFTRNLDDLRLCPWG